MGKRIDGITVDVGPSILGAFDYWFAFTLARARFEVAFEKARGSHGAAIIVGRECNVGGRVRGAEEICRGLAAHIGIGVEDPGAIATRARERG